MLAWSSETSEWSWDLYLILWSTLAFLLSQTYYVVRYQDSTATNLKVMISTSIVIVPNSFMRSLSSFSLIQFIINVKSFPQCIILRYQSRFHILDSMRFIIITSHIVVIKWERHLHFNSCFRRTFPSQKYCSFIWNSTLRLRTSYPPLSQKMSEKHHMYMISHNQSHSITIAFTLSLSWFNHLNQFSQKVGFHTHILIPSKKIYTWS